MRIFSSVSTAFVEIRLRVVWYLFAIPLLFLFNTMHAQAGVTLFLEEPYSYDGALAGTGHAAVYLDHVCAASPVELRMCEPGETGIVLSRYHRIGGYDWIAIPLVPYLYAVERPEDVPLYANAKLVAFLRDQYRRKYLEPVVPDLPGGGTPGGEWYELIGASYLRTIYGFAIESSPEQDALLINKFNSQRNHAGFNLVTHNCADFAREVVDFYFPHAVHRDVIFDLGVTTPKQIAKMLAKYSHRHPELQSSSFVIPQVPGAIPRSKPVHGVVELALSAKKYMVPMLLLHPYIFGGALAAYFGHSHFNPAQHALVLDSRWQLDKPMTSADRRFYLSELDELKQMGSVRGSSSDSPLEGKTWEQLQAGAEPEIDSSGTPVVQVRIGGQVANVGISRANVLSNPGWSDLASKVLVARIQQELRPAMARKAAHSEVAGDLALLRELLSSKPQTGLAGIFPSPDESMSRSRIQTASDIRP
jgi:hypothetical protein